MFRIIILSLVLFSLFTVSCTKNKTVIVTGEFPKEVESYAKIIVEKNGEKWQHSSRVIEGEYKFELDSLEAGIYHLEIKWSVPFEKRFYTKRDKEGRINKKYNPKGYWTRNLNKSIYINPDQHLQYHVKFEQNVSEEMIYELTEDTTNRSDLYRLQVISESEDAQLFDRLDSIGAKYTGYSYSLVLDSLFEASDTPNKLYRDFVSLARKQNMNNNNTIYIDKKLALAEKNLSNPVAVLEILNVNRRFLIADLDKYKGLLERVEGRAKESSYYESLKRKIQELPVPLKEGDELPDPTGHTPNYDPITFDPSDQPYSIMVFWAGWDEACRLQNIAWNRMLDRYGNRGLQVLGLSVDENIDDWRNAIEKEHLQRWFHISDLGQGFSGDNVLRHGVQSIPFALLIDQQGRIVSKNVKPEDVEAFLERNL